MHLFLSADQGVTPNKPLPLPKYNLHLSQSVEQEAKDAIGIDQPYYAIAPNRTEIISFGFLCGQQPSLLPYVPLILSMSLITWQWGVLWSGGSEASELSELSPLAWLTSDFSFALGAVTYDKCSGCTRISTQSMEDGGLRQGWSSSSPWGKVNHWETKWRKLTTRHRREKCNEWDEMLVNWKRFPLYLLAEEVCTARDFQGWRGFSASESARSNFKSVFLVWLLNFSNLLPRRGGAQTFFGLGCARERLCRYIHTMQRFLHGLPCVTSMWHYLLLTWRESLISCVRVVHMVRSCIYVSPTFSRGEGWSLHFPHFH